MGVKKQEDSNKNNNLKSNEKEKENNLNDDVNLVNYLYEKIECDT